MFNFNAEDTNVVDTNELAAIVVFTYKKIVSKRVLINEVSTIEKPVVVVRNICEANIGLKRKDLVALATQAGVNINTARTQVQRYLKRIKDTTFLALPSPESFA
jgi:hypothetical protein